MLSLRILFLSQSLSLKIINVNFVWVSEIEGYFSVSSWSLRIRVRNSRLVSSRDDKKCLLLTSCSLLSKNLEIYFSSKFIWEKVVWVNHHVTFCMSGIRQARLSPTWSGLSGGEGTSQPTHGVGVGGIGADLIFPVIVAQHCSKQSLNQKAWNEKIHKRKLFIVANFCMLVEKAFLKKIVSISHYYSLWLYVDGWTENETPAFLTRQMISFHGGLLTDAHLVWAAGRVLGNRSKSDNVAYWVEGGEQPISPGISFCWSRFYLAFIILSCAFYIVLAMEEHSWKLYVGVSHL